MPDIGGARMDNLIVQRAKNKVGNRSAQVALVRLKSICSRYLRGAQIAVVDASWLRYAS